MPILAKIGCAPQSLQSMGIQRLRHWARTNGASMAQSAGSRRRRQFRIQSCRARRTRQTAPSGRQRPTCCGCRISPVSRRGKGSFMLLSSTMPLPERSSGGASAPPLMPGSSLMPSNRLSVTAVQSRAWGWCITATAAVSICRSNTPNGWPKRASNPRSEALVTAMTTHRPRQLTACSKPRSSTVVVRAQLRGGVICNPRTALRRCKHRLPANRSTGSITAACLNQREYPAR
jgi:hypothetical protein